MLDFSYVQEQYDALMETMFDSSFMINATIHIASRDVGTESTYRGTSDRLDGRHVDAVKKAYPLDLAVLYRVLVLPLERVSMNLNEASQISYGVAGKYEPFDRWISCFRTQVEISNDNTYFDFADKVDINGFSYMIKGVVKENFGKKAVVHVFLVKETKV